ncbi:MAG: ABC transporter substrate-binding protein [Clostridiaceae bacterium]|jgi:taurine transport system substrate-binding protein|nr:ABC transporter substrate-binding protein [Eubacteriales bacterium]NLV48112.1 ABC transporter substrate-binding protein [Clostridiaceae bacterium]
MKKNNGFQQRKKSARLWLIVVLMLCLVIFPAGCRDDNDFEWPEQINIGYLRVPNDETIAKAEQYFEDYFADKGIDCSFIVFDSGVDANKALLSNSIDFATMGHTNAVIALATGIKVELVWIHEVLGKAEQLVVRQNSGIERIEDLAGRQVATVFASTAHYSLLNALRDAGIEDQVTLLDMQTADIVAAWERGDIDAAYTWQPTLDRLLAEGLSLVSSEEMAERGVVTANVLLARQGFSQKYPILMADFISALAKAGDLYRADPEKAAQIAGDELEIPTTVASEQMSGSLWLTREEALSEAFMGTSADPGHFVQVMHDTAAFLAEQQSIQSIPTYEDFAAFVNPEWIEQSLQSEQN